MNKKFEVEKDFHNTRFDRWFKNKVLDIPQGLIEKIIRKNLVKINGKKNNLSNKKRLFSKLQDKSSVVKVFDILSSRYEKRKGGYSRVLKAGYRYGDDAPMAIIELVDRNIEAKKVDKPKKIVTKEKDTAPVAATK